jgi:hypothetical protein
VLFGKSYIQLPIQEQDINPWLAQNA